MTFSIWTILLVFIITLVGSTYGAIFGGGSFFIFPCMLALGILPHLAIANDVASAAGSDLGSALFFFRKKHRIDWNFFSYWLPGLLVGPWIANLAMEKTGPRDLKTIILSFCLLGSFVLMVDYRKNAAPKALPKHWKIWSVLSGFLLGFYATYSGAGSAMFAQMLLMFFFGFSLKDGMAVRNYMMLITQAMAMITYLKSGWIRFELWIPMFISALSAGYLGTHLVHRMDEKLLKRIFFVIVLGITCFAFYSG